jgi:hypothetical protein
MRELDESQWRVLDNLIERMIKEARGTMLRALLSEIRSIDQTPAQNKVIKHELYDMIERKILLRLENGEINESQHDFLYNIIQRKKGLIS